MFDELTEEFDLQKLHENLVIIISHALGIDSHYFMNREQIIKQRDLLLEQVWDSFGDVPIDDKEEIEHAFMHWPSGTDRFEIWHWFDEKHSKGVAYLTNANGERNLS